MKKLTRPQMQQAVAELARADRIPCPKCPHVSASSVEAYEHFTARH